MKSLSLRLFLIGVLFPCSILAQSRTWNHRNYIWKAYTGNYRFTEHLGLHTDLQFRWNGAWTNFRQFIGRAGIEYHLSPAYNFAVGYAYAYTDVHIENPVYPHAIEHRAWQQFILQHKLVDFRMQHRFRLENRWFIRENAQTGGTQHTYTNRFRYQFRTVFPLSNHQHITHFKAIFSAEAMLGFNTQMRNYWLDQTRLYAGVIYDLTEEVALQIGYQNMVVFSTDRLHAENGNVLLFAITIKHDFTPID